MVLIKNRDFLLTNQRLIELHNNNCMMPNNVVQNEEEEKERNKTYYV